MDMLGELAEAAAAAANSPDNSLPEASPDAGTTGPASAKRARKRPVLECAQERVTKAQAALATAEGIIATIAAKGSAATVAEKKKASRAQKGLDDLRAKLARETEALEAAQQKASNAQELAAKRAAAAAAREEATRQMSNGALLLFVEIRCRYQSRFDNSSDQSSAIWERIVHEFNFPIRASVVSCSVSLAGLETTLLCLELCPMGWK